MKKKILSLLTAFAMVFGILVAPFTSAKADEVKTTDSVTLHKILMDKTTFAGFTAGTKGKNNEEYVGNKITNVKDFFAGTNAGTDAVAKEIAGAYFAWQKLDEEHKYKTNDSGVFVDAEGKVIQDGITDVSKLEEANKGKLVENWKFIKKSDGTFLDAKYQDLTSKTFDEKGFKNQVLGGETTEDGYQFNTKVLNQDKPTTYKIVEIHSLSSYKGDKGETLTDMKAVPVEITLPLVNENGVVKDAHVYPKNTQEKPKIDKNFDKEDNKTGEIVNAKGIKETELINSTEDNKKDVEIITDTNDREKGIAAKSVGETVPYKVVTEIPAQTKWATAKWDDKMTEGLTYNQDLTIELKKGNDVVKLTANTDYKLTQDEKGFVLEFLPAGLKLLNDKAEKQTITLKYTAKVNDKSVVKVPESNDITFHYGNNPGHGNTPIPTKPKENGELEVEKTWADGVPKAGEWATFTLINANTGKKIGTVKFETTASGTTTTYTAEAGYQAIGNEKPQGPTTKTDSNNVWTFKFTGLDKNLEYKIEEANNMNETAKFTKGTDGQIKIENKKDNNPTPLNPSEPKVVTYGVKFVKTNVEGERLPGAEFVVKNEKNKFLVEGTKATRTEYEAAQTAFVSAVKDYNAAVKKGNISDTNKAIIGGKEFTTEATAKAEVARLEKARDAAWNATLQSMDGFTADSKKADGVLKLTSNELGQFEIAGLAPGKYSLVEVKAPKDYVDADKATLEFDFEIGKDGKVTSQKMSNIDFGIEDKDQTNDNAKQIINKKVTIPQTGGIGSLIFIVAGAAIMIGAFVAYKKSQAVEA
ncbi:pilin N-terminal domain-containing protein [Anaerococcus degeneri]|uniref:Isopeptide-forming domain-containing fimbrial protein n=1 Tax=Anaerococcus degeneri TaxID=361500 RepID=A0ABS7YXT3_9FIRM|nr:pilin N-terminal domain-containing protein [Anaerococcus degeneri]MBP2015575.1 fimbrial isopeptide formation D2 family protein/LPXTG-motif cell wall-anchored protein [Anaerococcus degeneri]MCA2095929.1 isopeptide-forming domain-containing fimbrial protein [Anaerococcus degeneri]